jgi:transcriptional regulator with XRE-family HTH domain
MLTSLEFSLTTKLTYGLLNQRFIFLTFGLPPMGQMNIGQKIGQIRLQKKLTLKKLAQRIGFTKSYLSMVKLAKKPSPIASLSKISQTVQADIATFLGQKKSGNSIERALKMSIYSKICRRRKYERRKAFFPSLYS